MWEKFTERTRRIVYKAQEEAHRYGHPKVGTEHLLLGILDEPDTIAARVLSTLQGGLEKLRVGTIAALQPGAGGPATHIGLTRSARHALELAQDEASQQGADHIGTDHLLLGIVRCHEGGAAQVLTQAGITLGAVRDEVSAERAGTSAAALGEDTSAQEHVTAKALPPLVRSALGRSWDHLSYRSRAAVEAALAEAAGLGDTLVTPEHLLLGILRDNEGGAARILARLNVAISSLRSELAAGLSRHGEPREVDRQMELRAVTRNAIAQAELAARTDGDGQITTTRLLMGLLSNADTPAAALLLNKGVDLGALRALDTEVHQERAGRPPIDMTQLANLTLSQLIVRSQLKGGNLLRISDLSAADVAIVFAVTDKLKARKQRPGTHDESSSMHRGKTLALVFQKPSLRTRVTFEIGMNQLGGNAIHLGPDEIGVGEREAPADVAHNLERWVDGIVARTFSHKLVEDLAKNSSVPVINGLSDLEHPCQALADLYTMRERFGELTGLTLAWVGDSNNVSRSLLELCARTGVHMRLGAPKGYHFDQSFVDEVTALGAANGAKISVHTDAKEACRGADAVYTDVWASMGQEDETAKRHEDFQGFQLNMDLMAVANPNAIVLHCQPAHRGEEISSEAMDCSNSAVFDQAENRMHVQKALLALML
ncbi:MAG TPA: ornithine carbamoyltransferase [Armatimonadota bacterium]|jgi:ornithine carbamoyltransferase